jgi:hypothetical protein
VDSTFLRKYLCTFEGAKQVPFPSEILVTVGNEGNACISLAL